MKRDLIEAQSDLDASAEDPPGENRMAAAPPAPSLKRALLGILIGVLPIAGGMVIAGWLIATRPAARRSGVEVLPPLVQTVTVTPVDVLEIFEGYGSARANRAVSLSAEVNGQIVALGEGIDDGAPVEAGQVLVQIDDREYRRRFEQNEGLVADARAQLDRLSVEAANARRLMDIAGQEVAVNREEYKRLEELFERDLASKREHDFARLALQRSLRELAALENDLALIEPRRLAAEAALDARKAELGLAELNVERCTIEAPFTGRVDALLVEVGDRIRTGTAVLTLVDPRHIEVPVELPLGVRPRVRDGAECTLTLDSLSNVAWTATVGRLSPVADQRSRTFTAYAEVDNAEQSVPLLPGTFLTARVVGPTLEDVLVVPRGSIIDGTIYVLDGERVWKRDVAIRTIVNERAVIEGDVSAGDHVVLTNLDKLFDGARVRDGFGTDEVAPVAEEPAVTPTAAATPSGRDFPVVGAVG